MKSIHIREIPEPTLNALKRLAKLHHRSLQGELKIILEEAARYAPKPSTSGRLKLNLVNTGNKKILTRDEIYGDDGR